MMSGEHGRVVDASLAGRWALGGEGEGLKVR